MKNLTPYNESNAIQVEAMIGKAMCAYANAIEAKRGYERLNGNHSRSAYIKRHELELYEVACLSEYEATVRCMAMFVKEHVPEICAAVIDNCNEEFGIS